MLIARRADTKARADFATWKMMAKLNGASSLPAEAETFLASYRAMLDKMTEPEANDATIQLIYKGYTAQWAALALHPTSAPNRPSRSPATSPPSNARRP